MKLTRLFLLLLSALITASCAKVTVRQLPKNIASSSEGMIYALPKTVVRVQFKLDRTARQGAPFAPFAAIFAPDGERVCADAACTTEGAVLYELQDGVAFSTYGEPDPDYVYLVEFSNGAMIDQTLSMTWNESGLLTGAGATVTNRAIDVTMAGVKMAAGVYAKGGLGAVGPDVSKAQCTKDSSANDEWVINVLRQHGAMLADALIESYCTIASADRSKLPNDAELLTKATQQYLTRIAPLRRTRDSVLTTPQALNAAAHVAALDAEISKLLNALYLGGESTKTWEGALDSRWIAQSKPFEVLLRIDPTHGFCFGTAVEPPADAKLIPKGMKQLDAAACATATPVFLRWDYRPRKEDQLSARIKDDVEGDRSFRYRIPAQVRMTVVDKVEGNDKHAFGAADLSIAQLGEVVSLPAKRRSKSLTYDLAFIESTGALKSFKLGAAGGLDAAAVDSLSAAAGTVYDAEIARETKRRTEQDELTILTREASLLRLRDEICTLRQKYGQSCAD